MSNVISFKDKKEDKEFIDLLEQLEKHTPNKFHPTINKEVFLSPQDKFPEEVRPYSLPQHRHNTSSGKTKFSK